MPDPLRPGNDKDYLYVDRNGNGDLTEEGDRVAATILKRTIRSSIAKDGFYDEPFLEFPIGEIKDREGTIYKDVKVTIQWFVASGRARSMRRRQDARHSGPRFTSSFSRTVPMVLPSWGLAAE